MTFATLLGAWAWGGETRTFDSHSTISILSITRPAKTQWFLSVVNGELAFSAPARNGSPTPNAPSVPVDMFGKSGLPRITTRFTLEPGNWHTANPATIRVVVDRELRARSKELAARHGCYLTADYSTDPPRVILTEKAERYSHWRFEKTGGGDEGFDAFIENENDRGKRAWLSMEEKDTIYNYTENGRISKGGVALRKLVLSYRKEMNFEIGRAGSK
jgi:hypothetical protein